MEIPVIGGRFSYSLTFQSLTKMWTYSRTNHSFLPAFWKNLRRNCGDDSCGSFGCKSSIYNSTSLLVTGWLLSQNQTLFPVFASTMSESGVFESLSKSSVDSQLGFEDNLEKRFLIFFFFWNMGCHISLKGFFCSLRRSSSGRVRPCSISRNSCESETDSENSIPNPLNRRLSLKRFFLPAKPKTQE